MHPTAMNMFRVYAKQHQQGFNKIIHVIGVPVIVLSLQILFCLIPVFSLNFAWIAFIAVCIFYLWMDWRLALITIVFLFLLTLMAQWISLELTTNQSLLFGSSVFVAGWILQFIGHYTEGTAPALFGNILQILVAPIFLSAQLCFLLGYRKDLLHKIK